MEYDFVFLPKIRDNLIKYGAKFDFHSLVGLLSCTYRLRGCFNKDFVRRVDDGDLQICSSFCEQFVQSKNWGILESFWKKYPDLVKGLDPALLLREEQLMP